MSRNIYDHICIIGLGKPAIDCGRLLSEKGCGIVFYDANEGPSALLKSKTEKIKGMAYKSFDKAGIFADILKLEGKVLLLSIVNPYIIPRKVLQKEGLCAINLHHSLLPAHPGRNAEAWAVFEQDKEAGITWHFVNEKVDDGNIILQKKTELDDKITSWKLLKLQNDLILEGFSEFADNMLCGELSGTEQKTSDEVKMHYSGEKPADGRFDTGWPAGKMSAFLRAMDYGPARVMGYPEIVIEEKLYHIAKYQINSIDESGDKICFADSGSLIIIKDGIEIKMELME